MGLTRDKIQVNLGISMTKDEAMAKVQVALNEAVDEKVKIEAGQDLVEDDILDSLDVISFLFELEEQTGLKFPEAIVEEEDLMNIDKLCAYIVSKAAS